MRRNNLIHLLVVGQEARENLLSVEPALRTEAMVLAFRETLLGSAFSDEISA